MQKRKIWVLLLGKVSKAVGDNITAGEYEEFRQHCVERNSSNDFDKFIENNKLNK